MSRDLQIQLPLHGNGVTPVNVSTPDGHTLFLWVLLGQNWTFPPSPPSLAPQVFHSCKIELYTSQLSKTGKLMQLNRILHFTKIWASIRLLRLNFLLVCFQLRKNIRSSYAYIFLFLPYPDYAGYADLSFVYQLVIWKMKTVIFPWSHTGIQ